MKTTAPLFLVAVPVLMMGLRAMADPPADPLVKPPVVKKQAVAQEGRIIVFVADDGSLSTEAFNLLANEKEVTAYVFKEKERLEGKGLQPKLHLKGEKEALFKHSRKAIRCASDAGVNHVVFMAMARPKVIREPEQALGAAEQKPSVDPNANPAEDPGNIAIAVGADGRIVLDGEAVDSGPDDRELRLLIDGVKLAALKHPQKEDGLKVRIIADADTPRARLLDVLNALASANIKSIVLSGGPDDLK